MESIVQFDTCIEDCVCENTYDSIKARNLSNLLRIQDVMNVMDGRIYTLDEVQERIIRFYNKAVNLS
jgi:hypothetical protein